MAVHGHDDEAAAATAVSGRYTTSASSSRRENIRDRGYNGYNGDRA